MALISRQQYQQAGQPQASMQASTQASSQPSKAPDMSAYAKPAGGFNAYNVPRTPPEGARQNDISGQVPSNQIWAQAYNQASNQYGGNTQAQSWTMPGSYSSRSFNPTTGQYSQPTGGQSWDGNMAYNAIDQRPGPIQATATGVGGNPMPWQDTLSQREAFVGNLSQRLGQYSGGQMSGPPSFDAQQLLSQADDQLSNGTFYNPFAQQNKEFQQARNNATQYMTGTQWQNPFGTSPQANNQQPSWEQPSYDPTPARVSQDQSSFEQFLNQRGLMSDYSTWKSARQPPRGFGDETGTAPLRPGAAQPRQDLPSGTPYNPQTQAASLPPVPQVMGFPDAPSYGEDPIAAKKREGKAKAADASGLQALRERWLSSAVSGRSYREKLGGKNFKDHTPDDLTDQYTGELWSRVNDGRLSQQDYDKAVAAMDTDQQQAKAKQAKVQQVQNEIGKWERATYGTRQGSGPPDSNFAQIRSLQQLLKKAQAGDPAAMAWRPRAPAPPPTPMQIVPANRRGSAARFGGLRKNGDVR